MKAGRQNSVFIKNIRLNLLYFYIEILKKRLDAINQLRIDRALTAMVPNFQYVYNLIPTLLHFHHPMLPGYFNGNVPHGICLFTPDKSQRVLFHKVIHNTRHLLVAHSEQPITGVYSMGSTSSIGQNYSSDLDIWICHKSWLNNEERAQLQCKCALIEEWATQKGVDVSLFLIDENSFRSSENINIGNQNYSFTSNTLLLDEFYRTAVRMGGKRIIWNIVPGEKEAHYDEYVLSLYNHGALSPNEWLDLGGLGTLSVEDCFSASLWQLYKSIDSPYKSVLKTLLLEAYSWEYPQTTLLAIHIKQRLHNNEIVSYGLDPYCMMLERVTYYLYQINDMTRLDLVRRCFYLKACEKLSQSLSGIAWRRKIIMHLVQMWGWNSERLCILDNQINWKMNQMRTVHKELLDAMMQSYRKLMNFASSNKLNVNAHSKEILLLTSKSKLYAAFEGKYNNASNL
ncbi:adenylate cyclase [Candidatus Palibaumannia cicadellinicola]|uniref:Adenylate cyclase n=1 Tax=Candidatus Palibaumannia cicadellinicola TaxID=186490 RepID=A0A088MXU4_9GAMM|nr:adenylate cyclase [Candidatus Baumannia cicadellinicola]